MRPAGHVDAGQSAHGHRHGGTQNGIGLGNASFGRQEEAGPQHTPGQDSGPLTEKGDPCPRTSGGRDHGSDQRRQAVGNDAAGLRSAGCGDRDRLHPVDTDRLLPARFVLESDVNEVVIVQHLRRRLGIAALVPIQRRQQQKARQTCKQGNQGGHEGAAPARDEAIDVKSRHPVSLA